MSKYTLANIHDANFVDIVVGLGHLAMAGLPARLVPAPNGGKAVQVIGDEPAVVAYAYRDGASYKVKSEVVLDYIEAAERRKLAATNLPLVG